MRFDATGALISVARIFAIWAGGIEPASNPKPFQIRFQWFYVIDRVIPLTLFSGDDFSFRIRFKEPKIRPHSLLYPLFKYLPLTIGYLGYPLKSFYSGYRFIKGSTRILNSCLSMKSEALKADCTEYKASTYWLMPYSIVFTWF